MQKIMRHHAAYQLPLESLDIVVVEDSRQMQTIIRSILTAMRVLRVRTFDSADDALQAMLAEPPHVLITDWRMEPISGYQLLRLIRQQRMEPLCFVPVLFVTGFGTRPMVEKTLRAGAHHVLVKPLSPSALHNRLQWITHDERKFRLDPVHKSYVIEGVDEALSAHSEKRQALERARLHHAKTAVPAPAEAAAQTKSTAAKPAPVQPAAGPVQPASGRGLGDLVRGRAAVSPKAEASSVQEKSTKPAVPAREAAPAAAKAKPAEPVRSESREPAKPAPADRVTGTGDFAVSRKPRPRRRGLAQ